MSEPARILNDPYLPLPEKVAPERKRMRRKSLNLSKSKLPSLFIVALLCYLAVSVGAEFSKLSNMQRDVLSIQKEVNDLQQRNTDLRQELQTVQTDAYVEKTAREKLGLIKKGETRVLTVAPGTNTKQVEVPTGSNPAAD